MYHSNFRQKKATAPSIMQLPVKKLSLGDMTSHKLIMNHTTLEIKFLLKNKAIFFKDGF